MIKCIAIDDEPLALKQIESYIRKTPFLELLKSFESPLEAISYLQETDVALMFVDINMPDLNGLDFVKSLENAPKIIFTTAYSQYAVEGFRVDALDYLLKPIDYATFLKASNKAKSWFDVHEKQPEQIQSNEDFLFIKSEYKIVRIKLDAFNGVGSLLLIPLSRKRANNIPAGICTTVIYINDFIGYRSVLHDPIDPCL